MNNDFGMIAPFLDSNGRLTVLPAKHKKKLAALWCLAKNRSRQKLFRVANQRFVK